MIHNLLLSKAADIIAPAAHAAFKFCWKCGAFPQIWKKGHLTPIPKTPRPSTDPRKYRPIALLSCMGKVYEKVIGAQLQRQVSHYPLCVHQAGFQPQRNCEEQILRLTEDILTSFESRSATDAVFLDISKAYDSVWHKGLLYKLKLHFNISGNLLRTIQSFLQNRSYCVRVGSTYSEWRTFNHGVPQGSVISPLLFIMYINDLGQRLLTVPGVKLAMFADDIAIWTDPTCPHSRSHLQRALAVVRNWSKDWRLQFNGDKCHYICFTRCRNIPPIPNLRVGGKTLQPISVVRYLGVWFDAKLTFARHVDHLCSKLYKRIAMARTLVDKSAGLTTKRFTSIYLTTIRPAMEYAVCAWGQLSVSITLS